MNTAPQRFIRRNVSVRSANSIAPLIGVWSASLRTLMTARAARAVCMAAAWRPGSRARKECARRP